MMYITLSINNHHLIDHLSTTSSSTTTTSLGEMWIGVNRRHRHRRLHDDDGGRWRCCCEWCGCRGDRCAFDELRWRSAMPDRQTHRHSRHQRRGGTGPVKIDEEGHLIYKDGDVLFERCTHHRHHFFVAVTLQLLLPCFNALHWGRSVFSYQSWTL